MPTRTDDARAITANLLRLSRLYRRQVNRALEAHAISEARALPVLHIARSGGGMRQGVLAEELGIEGPSLVRLLDQLCAGGLVKRRPDPTDGRAKTLHVTPAGADLAAKMEAILAALRAELLAGASDEDLAAARRVHEALEAAIEAADPAARTGEG